jgi:thioredoxin reductase
VLIAIVEDIAATAAATDLVRSDAMKSPTFDLVLTGDERAAIAAGLNAVRRGQRVLVVLRSRDGRVVGRLRRLCRAARSQLTVMTNAEVVCVDGVDGVEAVVMRYTRTGRLCAVNTSAFLSCMGSIAAEPPVRKSFSAAQTP